MDPSFIMFPPLLDYIAEHKPANFAILYHILSNIAIDIDIYILFFATKTLKNIISAYTPNLYYPNHRGNVFRVISALFGAFSSEKPCSRLRSLILSPRVPPVEVVKYVVKKSAPKFDVVNCVGTFHIKRPPRVCYCNSSPAICQALS